MSSFYKNNSNIIPAVIFVAFSLLLLFDIFYSNNIIRATDGYIDFNYALIGNNYVYDLYTQSDTQHVALLIIPSLINYFIYSIFPFEISIKLVIFLSYSLISYSVFINIYKNLPQKEIAIYASILGVMLVMLSPMVRQNVTMNALPINLSIAGLFFNFYFANKIFKHCARKNDVDIVSIFLYSLSFYLMSHISFSIMAIFSSLIIFFYYVYLDKWSKKYLIICLYIVFSFILLNLFWLLPITNVLIGGAGATSISNDLSLSGSYWVSNYTALPYMLRLFVSEVSNEFIHYDELSGLILIYVILVLIMIDILLTRNRIIYDLTLIHCSLYNKFIRSFYFQKKN